MRTLSVLGSVNIDLVLATKRIPDVGETVGGGKFQRLFGGKGANQAVAAAALGARVRFFGCVGDDEYGPFARENLCERGIDVRGLKTVEGATGVALILLDAQGRNSIALAPGANAHFRPAGTHDIAVMQLETHYERPRAKTLILNPAPAPARKFSLRGVDFVIPNQIEAEQLTGCKDPRKAVQALERMGAGRAIVTLGARGVWCGGEVHERGARPAFRVRAVDTVGAGDCFVGAFAAALAKGHPDPVLFAQAAAALQVTRRGAQNVPSLAEVEGFLRKHA
ncbi:MAG: ribokinase [Planctomycetes bacterium]|nr:ribokinase [Planctomycetota bacterium]